jgi:hypothetical protein
MKFILKVIAKPSKKSIQDLRHKIIFRCYIETAKTRGTIHYHYEEVHYGVFKIYAEEVGTHG